MLALAVPTEVDGMGVYVDVHEVVDNFTLDVVLHPVDQETLADIYDLDKGQVPAEHMETSTTKSESTTRDLDKIRKGYLVLLV